MLRTDHLGKFAPREINGSLIFGMTNTKILAKQIAIGNFEQNDRCTLLLVD